MVQSVPAYPSILDVRPGRLAVIVVPALIVRTSVPRRRKAFRALVVISSGFAEVGGEGRQR